MAEQPEVANGHGVDVGSDVTSTTTNDDSDTERRPTITRETPGGGAHRRRPRDAMESGYDEYDYGKSRDSHSTRAKWISGGLARKLARKFHSLSIIGISLTD